MQAKQPRTLLNKTDELMKNLHIALALAVLGTTLVGPSAQAQRRGSVSAGAGRGGGVIVRGLGPRAPLRRLGPMHRPFRRFGYAPYFYPGYGYDSDYGLNSGYELTPDEAPPQPVAEETSPAATPQTPEKPAEGPVLLELQGDHWVRITSNGPPQTVGQLYRPQPEKASNPPTAAASAVLVFRDGHEEEIGKYCIIGETIHVTADYWSTGSWTRTVKILDLDVPATLKLNQERGTNFRLPSGPYEVMVGG